jgi:hypothetical protein
MRFRYGLLKNPTEKAADDDHDLRIGRAQDGPSE